MRSGAVVAYLGEEGALAVGELDFGDIEELKLPLGEDQHCRIGVRRREGLPESLPFCYQPIIASSQGRQELSMMMQPQGRCDLVCQDWRAAGSQSKAESCLAWLRQST